MAAQFCMQCGTQLPGDAQFCAKCGHPIGAGASPGGSAGAPAPPPPAAPTATAAPPTPTAPAAPAQPLGVTLGVSSIRNFLLQHQLLSTGRNFRVLSHEKKHLFTVHENLGQEFQANLANERPSAAVMGLQMGFVPPPSRTLLWSVVDSSGATQGTIGIQVTGRSTVATLMDASRAPQLIIDIQRSLVGGLTAKATFPDGREMFHSHGNALHHNFIVQDPNGGEVAKIHEAWASVRDTYNLDVLGPVDPVCPLVFAIMIEVEKAQQ